MKKSIKKSKRKFKGTRYVAKVLNKYFKKKYPNYTSALPKAREITEKLKSSGQKFTIKNVEAIVRKHRIKKEPITEVKKSKPLLFYKLVIDSNYYDLQDYSTYINDTTNEIYFTSSLFNEGVTDIQGGTRPSYNKTFSSFVDYLNKNITSREDAYDYLVRCTEPEFNEENKRWESRIISVDPSGEEMDFGYSPTKTQSTSIAEIDKKLSQEEPKKSKQEPKSQKVKELELELTLSKEKLRIQANEMFLKGLFTKKEYKDEIDRINKL
jgi:hypothetical protein